MVGKIATQNGNKVQKAMIDLGFDVNDIAQPDSLSAPRTARGAAHAAPAKKEAKPQHAPIEGAVMLRRDDIEPHPTLGRETYETDADKDLVISVAKDGIYQPLIVRPHPGTVGASGQHYQLVAGSRRYWAAKQADLEFVPCIVRDMSELVAHKVAVIENAHRLDTNAIDRSRHLNALSEELTKEIRPGRPAKGSTTLKMSEVAKEIGMSERMFRNYLSIAGMPEETQKFVQEHKLTIRHSIGLAALNKHPEAQLALQKEIVRKSLSGADTERRASELAGALENRKPKAPRPEFVTTHHTPLRNEATYDYTLYFDSVKRQTEDAIIKLGAKAKQGDLRRREWESKVEPAIAELEALLGRLRAINKGLDR